MVGYRDLDIHAAVGATLMQLACGMQEARTKAERHRQLEGVPQFAPDEFERLGIGGLLLQVGHQREVVAGAGRAQVRRQHARQVGGIIAVFRAQVAQEFYRGVIGIQADAVGGKCGSLLRQFALGFEHIQQAVGVVLALGDVRLIERVDFEHHARDSRGKFPAEELRANVEGVAQIERHQRISRFLQRFHLFIRVAR